MAGMWMSRFECAEDSRLRILDFSFRPAVVAAMLVGESALVQEETPHGKMAVAYAIAWPLIAACSLASHKSNVPFNVEHIVPQLLMRWLQIRAEADPKVCYGLRYFSTKIRPYELDRKGVSYVFPAHRTATKGVCELLKETFCWTGPVQWQLAVASDIGHPPGYTDAEIEPVAGVKIPYKETQFGRVEALLSQAEAMEDGGSPSDK